MRNLISVTILYCLLISCKKNVDPSYLQSSELKLDAATLLHKVQNSLLDSLSVKDYNMLDFDRSFRSKDVQSGNYFIRVGLKDKNLATDFVLLQCDSPGKILQGKILHADRLRSSDHRLSRSFNGQFIISSLNRKNVRVKQVINGRWKIKSHGSTLMMVPDEDEEPAGEQTLPPVVITAYVNDGGSGSWYWYGGFFDNYSGGGGTYTYEPADPSADGGGGGSYEPVVNIDFDDPEYVDAVDVKKYLDCFGSIQAVDATYTVTIATDIPVDGDPSVFFNWSEGSPGHTYVELYKSSDASGLIQQNIGFYPNASWKAGTGGSIPSKIADDAGHEYNARYTIAVSASQFQAALNAATSYSTLAYNIATFNCTDFALVVFNAAGGNLTIPRHTIPGFENGPAGSNTPQGLYDRLSQMNAQGNTHVEMPGIKGYGGSSHGPCN